ncbi:MAG: class I SAM-dependent methyltransferase [Candidatus Eisenbacteria bacterium]
MSYKPQEFWDQRLSDQFDLRGTGETGLSLAYNEACYALRREVLDRALREVRFDPRSHRILDVGCGSGFWADYYLQRGALYTGMDISSVSIDRLSKRYPQSRFIHSDVSEVALEEHYDAVNAFDVLYHITDDARWETAVRNLASGVTPGGLFLVTDVFSDLGRVAEHNVMRPLARYMEIIAPLGFAKEWFHPTHVLLNHELGVLRFLNRMPALLLSLDRALLGMGAGQDDRHNRLLVARRTR